MQFSGENYERLFNWGGMIGEVYLYCTGFVIKSFFDIRYTNTGLKVQVDE